MEHWYIPITIVPGIGLLLMSTSQLLVALSKEIKEMITEARATEALMQRKLRQLKILSTAMVFLYLSVACFIISGLIMAMVENYDFNFNFSIGIVILGIACALWGLILLVVYAYRAVRIRQDQYHNRC